MRDEYAWTDETAIDDFLNEMETGVLGTIDEDGWPHCVPVNYIWHGGSVYFHCGPGSKLDNLRREPKVSFTVVEALSVVTSEFSSSPCRNTQLGRSVVIKGLAGEVRSPEQKQLMLNKLIGKYDPQAVHRPESEKMTLESLTDLPGFSQCRVVKIETREFRARLDLLQNKPEKYLKTMAAHFQKLAHEEGRERDAKTALLINQLFLQSGHRPFTPTKGPIE